tara:strand:+ start:155 stop:259 length:105 start_codon:yes stop_codon:yes gene_type:complete
MGAEQGYMDGFTQAFAYDELPKKSKLIFLNLDEI